MISIADGTNLVFRYWHGIPPKELYPFGKTQMFNNVLYGWFNQIARWAHPKSEVDLDQLTVVFDGPGCRIREFYPEYKAQRSEKPEGFYEQVKVLMKMTEWLGIKVVQSPDEADPAIVYLAKAAAAEREVQMISSDKDMMQVVRDEAPGRSGCAISQLRPENKGGGFKRFRERDVVEKLGVPPRLVPQLLAIWGDTSDNVPGIRGIGEKGAVELLTKYGSLKGIVENAANLPKGQRNKLAAGLPSLPTYLRVVRIEPLMVSVPTPNPNPKAFMGACAKLGLLKQMEELMEAGMVL